MRFQRSCRDQAGPGSRPFGVAASPGREPVQHPLRRHSLTVPDLLARASSRVQVRSSDGKSGSIFERVEIDGERYFVKSLSLSSDWIMRITGDHVHRPYLIWQSGIMARAPASIDHATVAMQVSGVGDDAELTVVMRDVGAFLVPEGDAVVPASHHRGFIEHMADLACAFWGWNDDI